MFEKLKESSKFMIGELDKFILTETYNSYKDKNNINSWELAKKYAKLTNSDLNYIYRNVKYRLNNYCKTGIFVKQINGKNKYIYKMDLDKITFARHKFSDGFKWCLILRIV